MNPPTLRLTSALLAAVICGGCAGAKPRPSKALTQPRQTLTLGAQAWRDGDLTRARTYFANAHTQYRSIDDRLGQLQALLNLATLAVMLGETAQADDILRSASGLLLNDDPLTHRVQLLRAQTHLLNGNWDAARTELAAVLAGSADASLLTTAVIERARLAALAGEPIEPWLERARARVDDESPYATRASLKRLEATAARQDGDGAARRRHLEAALELYRASANRPGIAATHTALAEEAAARGADAQARDHYLKSLHIQLWIHDRVHASRTLGTLASMDNAAGNSAHADELRALQLLLQSDSAPPNWSTVQQRIHALAGR